jgi:hypothetical protein
VFSVATKIAQLMYRRRTLVLALTVVAAIAGARFGHPGHGLWDGPL